MLTQNASAETFMLWARGTTALTAPEANTNHQETVVHVPLVS